MALSHGANQEQTRSFSNDFGRSKKSELAIAIFASHRLACRNGMTSSRRIQTPNSDKTAVAHTSVGIVVHYLPHVKAGLMDMSNLHADGKVSRNDTITVLVRWSLTAFTINLPHLKEKMMKKHLKFCEDVVSRLLLD